MSNLTNVQQGKKKKKLSLFWFLQIFNPKGKKINH